MSGPSNAQVVPGDHPGAWVVRTGERSQSHVDTADPTRLRFDYVRRIADVVDAVPPAGAPLRVLHVGGAGLTLPRYVLATRPRSRQVVLEPDAELTALVREVAPLPPRSGISVRPVDGVTGLAALRDADWDVVVLDAFDAEGIVPPELLGAHALADVRRVLRPDGLLVANLTDRPPFDLLRRAHAGLTAAFAHVSAGAEPGTWKGGGRGRTPGNVVVVAAASGEHAAALARAARGHGTAYTVLGPEGLAKRLGV